MSRLAYLFCVTVFVIKTLYCPQLFADDSKPNAEVSYHKDVMPILRANCMGCHQPAKSQGQFVMTDFAALLKGGESETTAIVAGDVAASHLIEEITPVDGKASMPRNAAPLSNADIDVIRRWIEQGAKNDSPSSGPKYSAENLPSYARPPVITSLDFAPDGKSMSVTGFHEVLVFDTSSWQRTARLVGLNPRVESVRYSPDGTRLAATAGQPGLSGEVQVWDIANNKLLLSRAASFDTLFGVSWSPDAKLLAFGATDNIIRAIDSESGEQKLYQGTHEDWPRATVFSVSGGFLVSGGRDMTVKLTDVPTERFIDNVTSITPGVLKGGVNSIARHPRRDEILVGGSDGTPKLYRLFRQTARVIGDDANLLRKMGEMPGRIFAVAISADAKFFAAASTVDGQSQVRLWRYDVEEQLPAEIRAIQAKSPADRTAEERKLIEAFTPAEPVELAKWDVPETAIYAMAFDASNRLATGGADGKVRVWDSGTLQLAHTFDVTPSSENIDEQVGQQLAESRTKYMEQQVIAPVPNAETPNVDPNQLVRIEVQPTTIDLTKWNHYTQLQVTGFDAQGLAYDVTDMANYAASPPVVWVDKAGLVQTRSVGECSLDVKIGSVQHSVQVRVGESEIAQVDFVRDVNPVLSRLGCNAGTCHGAQAGKRGFKLSLRGYDPLFDKRALTDDLASRRINLSAPHESLMLSKPFGNVPHEGGRVIQEGDRYATTIEQWIRQGATLDTASPRVAKIEVSPFNPVVQKPGSRLQVRVVATYVDGSTRDVSRDAFIESGNPEVATVGSGARLISVRRGEAPILARYEGSYAATTLTVMGDREGFEWKTPEVWGPVDELVASKWERMKIAPSEVCNDETFLRRVTLDLTGLPPTTEQIREFLADPTPSQQKREAWIDKMLASEEFVDQWANKWCDLLQVNSKFLGKEGATSFREWVRKQVAENTPYNSFVYQIMTATGSNRENPAASYFKILRTPEEVLENSTHLFLAVRFNCNKCHDHPFERWTQDQYYQTAAYFSQIGLKKDEASGDRMIGGTAVEGAKPLFEEVFDTGSGEVKQPRTNQVATPTFPFTCDYKPADEPNRRKEFASWLTSPNNPYFAKSYVNRLWGYLLGVGLIEPLDDIRAGNPASNPELLSFLEKEFIQSGFDTRHVIRTICRSRAYQLSVASNRWNKDDDRNYSHAKARRLPAEVIFDAVHRVTGTPTRIPGVAEGTRAAALADAEAGLPDGFLNNFGRPARESACECERSSDLRLGSIMALVSGPTIGQAISDGGNELHKLITTIGDDRQLVNELYLRILNRNASEEELNIALDAFKRLQADHDLLVQKLAERETWWSEEKPKREGERNRLLQETQTELANRIEAIRPDREMLEAQRMQRIVDAETKRSAHRDAQTQKFEEFLAQRLNSADWYPLSPAEMKSTNGAKLTALPDRSIRVDGSKDKTMYSITVPTKLQDITAVRLEALAAPDVPGGGPGLPGNGNFVVTEFELFAGPAGAPDQLKKIKIKTGQTDFDQAGFSAAAAIDGNIQDQGGWAVHPAGGSEHWAVFTLDQPLKLEPGWILEFRIHQVHDAQDHRLARFRIGVTTQTGDIPLGLSENLAYIARTSSDARSKDVYDAGLAYFKKADKELQLLEAAVGVAQQAVPEDEQVVAIQKRIERLGIPTPDDSRLLQLRLDLVQSQEQLGHSRMTSAEDLTWALINSPAFLFNY